MKIACLGWGSLIWNPKDLPIQEPWFEDGPMIPVEFARESLNGRITLVITPGARLVQSLWSIIDRENIEAAKKALRLREETSLGNIGVWKTGDIDPQHIPGLSSWANTKNVGGVIWTALPPKFGGENRTPSVADVIGHLSSLSPEKLVIAKEYVARAPKQIETLYRKAIESELGWTPKE